MSQFPRLEGVKGSRWNTQTTWVETAGTCACSYTHIKLCPAFNQMLQNGYFRHNTIEHVMSHGWEGNWWRYWIEAEMPLLGKCHLSKGTNQSPQHYYTMNERRQRRAAVWTTGVSLWSSVKSLLPFGISWIYCHLCQRGCLAFMTKYHG